MNFDPRNLAGGREVSGAVSGRTGSAWKLRAFGEPLAFAGLEIRGLDTSTNSESPFLHPSGN
jgi:hypothetical protein